MITIGIAISLTINSTQNSYNNLSNKPDKKTCNNMYKKQCKKPYNNLFFTISHTIHSPTHYAGNLTIFHTRAIAICFCCKKLSFLCCMHLKKTSFLSNFMFQIWLFKNMNFFDFGFNCRVFHQHKT